MTKKPKRAKTPKAPKGRAGNGGGKDPVTGVYFSDIGERIESDKVYDSNSDFVKKIRSLSNPNEFDEYNKNYTTEFEFGGNFIVWTMISDDHRFPGIEMQRVVAQGEFKYNNGTISSARISAIAIGDAIAGNAPPTGEEVSKFPQPMIVDNPSSFYSWRQSIDKFYESAAYEVNGYSVSGPGTLENGQVSVMRIDGGREIWETGDGIAAVRAFGSGNFFYDGWQSNPFDSNLI